jgi:hypothetical protein
MQNCSRSRGIKCATAKTLGVDVLAHADEVIEWNASTLNRWRASGYEHIAGRETMATYIMLASLTDQGIRKVKDSPKRADAFKDMAKVPFERSGVFSAPTEAPVKGGVAIQQYTPATRPARPLTKQPP